MLFWAKAKIFTMLYKVLHDVESTSPPWPDPTGLPVHPASVMLAMIWKPLCSPGLLLPRRALAVLLSGIHSPQSQHEYLPHVLQVFFPKLTFSMACFLDTQVWILPSYFAMSYARFPCFFSFYNYCSLTYNIYYLDILFIDWIPQ